MMLLLSGSDSAFALGRCVSGSFFHVFFCLLRGDLCFSGCSAPPFGLLCDVRSLCG
jgi:hypothetical protein